MGKKVRFNDIVKVYPIPKEDRRPSLSWILDRLRFTDRIKKTEQVLQHVLINKISSIQNSKTKQE